MSHNLLIGNKKSFFSLCIVTGKIDFLTRLCLAYVWIHHSHPIGFDIGGQQIVLLRHR